MSVVKKRNAKAVRQRNFVQAHVMEVNVPQVFEDRRMKERSGYRKHKRSYSREEFPDQSYLLWAA